MYRNLNSLAAVVLSILAAIVMLSATSAPALALTVNDTETANISVIISTVTMVNLDPYVLSWQGLQPGDIGTNDTEVNNYFAIQIENIGSHNITHIWFNATYPSSNPFGTANVSAYDAGNFVVLATEPTGGATASSCNALDKYDDYKYPNRVEYPEVRSLVYVRDPNGNMPPENFDYGRFRFADEEFFWMVSNDTDCSGKTFYIGNVSHTETRTGTVDFSSSTDIVQVNLNTAVEGWCYGNISGHSELDGYGVLVQNGTSGANRKVMLVWWNKDALSTGAVGHYFYEGNLVPGNSTAACIKVYIPYGVYEGTVKTGILTVVVNSV